MKNAIVRQRMTASIEGDFVLFVIGMRVNRWWKIHKWLPVAIAMPRMIKELLRAPESGFIAAEQAFGNPTIMLQYWRTFEQLEAYAKNANQEHLPAWRAFNRRVATNGDVGIWHETYLISAGKHESIYTNMPPFGLGKVGQLVPATGAREGASGRIRA